MARDFLKQIREQQHATPRVAIKQVDPGEPKSRPEPPAPTPTVAQPPAIPAADREPVQAPMHAEPEAAPVDTSPEPAQVVVLEPDDPRTKPTPPDDSYIVTSVKIKAHQQSQLRAEVYHRQKEKLFIQDILETALDEYFKKRYGRQGRGENQRQPSN
jgi:hypothetical protein